MGRAMDACAARKEAKRIPGSVVRKTKRHFPKTSASSATFISIDARVGRVRQRARTIGRSSQIPQPSIVSYPSGRRIDDCLRTVSRDISIRGEQWPEPVDFVTAAFDS